MYKVVKKFNNICEKYEHHQNFDNNYLNERCISIRQTQEKK